MTDHLAETIFYESRLLGTDLSTVVSFSHFRLENLKNKYTFLLARAHKHRYTQTSVVNISVFMQTYFFFKIAIKSDFDNKVCTGALMCVCVMFL